MKTAGIYIHIPFCAIKCNYCDFYSITESESLIPRFIKAICKADFCKDDGCPTRFAKTTFLHYAFGPRNCEVQRFCSRHICRR